MIYSDRFYNKATDFFFSFVIAIFGGTLRGLAKTLPLWLFLNQNNCIPSRRQCTFKMCLLHNMILAVPISVHHGI